MATYSDVRVDGGVASGAGEALAVLVGDVLVLLVDVALGEAVVDDVDRALVRLDADEEVVGLDVAVQEVAVVEVLDALQLRKQGERVSERAAGHKPSARRS